MLAWEGWYVIFGMPQIAIIMGALVPIVGVIAHFWYKARTEHSANELKRTLVNRGYTVDDIERILAVQAEKPGESR
ncbi:MAG: hypothetical protein H6819_07305 [Phycisphaerales bacterium]|nr:hypothetical protein [Phycisphaerales bacterium]MCB9857699.1 hypothetical protein [Phycisphaerales bacterium]MCB9864788.1 hypothetical protein [Phycisphaerales bacterium]